MSELYVQYGCGLRAPKEWKNFDASPTLRVQKIPLLSWILKSRMQTRFPDNVKYGDIIKGLPINENSCSGVYCSHVLEHLSLNDFRKALKNTLRILKPGGLFRCVVPDLEFAAIKYVEALRQGDTMGSLDFCGPDTLLGLEDRARGIKGLFVSFLGNSRHLWMWDAHSLAEELKEAGFRNVRVCQFNDSEDPMFKYVEEEGRFVHAVAIESIK